MRHPIRLLPPLLVNQIAAGEVIERPASVVKELIENALDAETTRISIAVEQGGRDLIEVCDDGVGISAEDLPLAIAPHATSKIGSVGDLESVRTLGFRGEALASIAAVSRLTLISRTGADESATRIEASGDEVSAPVPAAGPRGTTVSVRNLFFNTPARRKFLRAPQTEFNHVLELLHRLAMSHPAVGFTLSHNERVVFEAPPDQSPPQRIGTVIGRELENQLLEISSDGFGARSDAATLWGMAGTPAIARRTNKYQFVFLNGRFIRDKTISHAIKEAYRGLVDAGRFPLVILFIEMDPTRIDVNVHPTKAEVRFHDSQSIHGLVLSALRQRLLNADLTPQVGAASSTTSSAGTQEGVGTTHDGIRFQYPENAIDVRGSGNAAAPHARGAPESSSALVERLRAGTPSGRGFSYEQVRRGLEQSDDEQDSSATGAGVDTEATPATRSAVGGESGDNAAAFAADRQEREPGAPASAGPGRRPAQRVLQVHNSYIVVEDEQGLAIIDQHALHERILFEALKARILNDGRLESQRLLMPATIEVTATQIDLLESLKDLLVRLGIEAEPFGPTSIAIHACASLLFERGVDPGEFLKEILDRAAQEQSAAHTFENDEEAVLHTILDMMSCKAAVKAGDHLTPDELDELLRRRDTIERSSNCPHGRPTMIRLSLSELERQFGRR